MNTIEKWNMLLTFLAEKEEKNLSADVLILAGNCLPYLTNYAGTLLVEGHIKQIVLSGGVGHATEKLRNNYEKIGYKFSKKLSEAQMNANYLSSKFPINDTQLILETHSTNSGENARFSLASFEKAVPEEVLLMNDPILQRRTRATFEKEWAHTETKFENYVPFIPKLIEFSSRPIFQQSELEISWSTAYFKSLVLGELQRMQDNEWGYGTKGLNFMKDIPLPANVQKAFEELLIQENESLSVRRESLL